MKRGLKREDRKRPRLRPLSQFEVELLAILDRQQQSGRLQVLAVREADRVARAERWKIFYKVAAQASRASTEFINKWDPAGPACVLK